MRAVVQRVSSASVEIEGVITGQIGQGLMILLGITQDDAASDIDYLVKKTTQLRIFNDADEKMNLSVEDIKGDMLVISQFTLYADSQKGNRPSYIRSAPPAISVPLYEAFLTALRAKFTGRVETGTFGASMKVALVNEGPVTIILDSKAPSF